MPASGELAAGLALDIMTSMYYEKIRGGQVSHIPLMDDIKQLYSRLDGRSGRSGDQINQYVNFPVRRPCRSRLKMNSISLVGNIYHEDNRIPLNPMVDPAETVTVPVSPGVFSRSSS